METPEQVNLQSFKSQEQKVIQTGTLNQNHSLYQYFLCLAPSYKQKYIN